ncbi:MAG: peptidase [Cyanobacteria bacterium J055]|nr:MAG: peptidase [Cyanobacteria bacterium J055]
MTYCLGIVNQCGIVLAADSRTNAGVDYISTYRKLFEFCLPDKRAILICTSGNLSITQAIIAEVKRDLQDGNVTNLYNSPTFYDIARYLGDKVREIQDRERPWLERDRIDFQCNLLVGGQIQGEAPQLYLIYPQGNFIQATPETPFLQIGETKYGKPILDRTLSYDTPLEAVAKCALLSIDSTMKSNISVGPPINLIAYKTDSFAIQNRLKLRLGSPYLAQIRKLWEESLRQAFESIPDIEWQEDLEINDEEILID